MFFQKNSKSMQKEQKLRQRNGKRTLDYVQLRSEDKKERAVFCL